MKLNRCFMLVTLMVLLSASLCTSKAQHLGGSSGKSAEELKQGLVVESVARDSDAERMGFAAGDVILSWARGDHHGEIESPSDLLDVEIEELPRGTITLAGLRGAAGKSWVWPSPVSTVVEGTWGLVVRPNFSGSLLSEYQAGQAAAVIGNRTEATAHWQAIAEETQRQPFPRWLASWMWVHSANTLAANKEWSAADRACQQAVELAKGDSSEATMMLRACAYMFLQQGADEQAQIYYRKALANLQNSNPLSLTAASVLTALGRIAYANDDAAEGVAFVGQALKIQEQLIPESLLFATNLNRTGTMMQTTDELDQSKEYLLRVIALREKISPHSRVLASSLQNLGDTFVRRGEPFQAEPYHLRALKLWEELRPDSRELAGCLVDLANGADDRGELAQAEDYFRKALAIQRRLQPHGQGTAASLNNLGLLLEERGQLAAAEESFKESLAIKQEITPGSLNVATTLNNLGRLIAERGNLEQGETYVREGLAIRIKKEDKSTDLADSYAALGDLAWQRQDIPQSEEYYRKALAIYEVTAPNVRDTGDTLQSLGDAAWKSGDVAEAEKYYIRALQIREISGRSGHGYADALLALAQVAMRKQQWDVAAQRFEQGLEALEGQTARLGGTDEIRANFRAQHGQKYRAYVDLLLSQNQAERALDVLERSRARTLLETLAAGHIDVRQGADPELIGKERLLQASLKAKSERRINLLVDRHTDEQIKAIEKEISDLSSRYEEVEAQLRSSSPGYAALTQPQPLSAKEIQQQLLDRDRLLLEYSLGEERSHVFVVSSRSLRVFELPKRAAIERRAQHVYELLTERNRRVKDETYSAKAARIAKAEAEYPSAIARLSKTILGPVTGQLAGKRLLIVGDGALYYVPFAALPLSLPGKPLLPLAAEHEIVNLPSASVLAVMRRERLSRKRAAKMIAVLADPVFDRGDIRVKGVAPGEQQDGSGSTRAANETEHQQSEAEQSGSIANLTRSAADVGWDQERNGELYLPRLQFTRQEATAITTAAPPGQSFKALDFKASRAAAISPDLANYRIVHFATHAMVNNAHPELSGLVFSLVDEQGKPQNGFLDLQDIYNLNLPAELVVLSACQTGLGKKVEGEGLMGLTRGFMYAGANRVIASLWNVDDRATADFMRHFYIALLSQKMRPAAALRAAQLEMRNDKRWSSPHYWAAFQIQGEWK